MKPQCSSAWELVALVCLACVSTSCAQASSTFPHYLFATTTPPPTAPPPDYQAHGTDWQQGVCKSRERQSPINIDDHLKDPPTAAVTFHYEPVQNVRLFMQARQGLLFIDMSQQMFGGILYNGAFYPLVRIDFHTPAEHLIKGERKPMEIQLVHRKISAPDEQLIVSILVWSEAWPAPEEPPKKEGLPRWYHAPLSTEVDFNLNLQHFVNVEPPTIDGHYSTITIPFGIPLDLSAMVSNPLMPDSSVYIEYVGSQTTAPCVDKTTWLVRRVHMVASDSQVAAFAHSVYKLTQDKGNFRAVMPVNHRKLNVVNMVYSPVIDLTVKEKTFLGPNPRTDDEFRAKRLAVKAYKVSEQATGYMADFGNRLRASSKAQLEKLTPTSTPMPTNPRADMWASAVARTRMAIAGAARSVRQGVDETIRSQTLRVHDSAQREADTAHNMIAGQPAMIPTAAPPTTSLPIFPAAT